MRLGTCLIAAVLLSAPAFAADVPRAAIGDEHRLSPAEVQKVLDEAAARRETLSDPEPRRIEGEFGVAIGTDGYREAFGTAVVPLGQNGTAIISFDNVESNRGRVRRHR